ncbi:hypothetical protein [Sphingobium sp. CFD-1]|uniref:hypothetical protein n=1 Tax=Sphingobium sp. CFD-1 TaxID=2878545 RepID=UPI00214AA506|nr:hypothetical protein [Sphingobium sp. CFD-1]
MDRLQSALHQLADNVGGFDNIKFLLCGSEDMSRDHVTDHIEAIHNGLSDGSIRPASLGESSLDEAVFPL